MQSKWIVWSKSILALLAILATNLTPLVPAEWRPMVTVGLTLLAGIERWLGGQGGAHVPLTLFPPSR